MTDPISRTTITDIDADDLSGLFAAAWRGYVLSIKFDTLSAHDRALIRLAFVAGWHARMAADAQ